MAQWPFGPTLLTLTRESNDHGSFSMRASVPLALLAGLILAGGGFAYWTQQKATRIPDGFASANGRLEVERVDIASKYAGRVAEIGVKEGDDLDRGAVVARLDTSELLAQLAAAKAAVQRAAASISRAEAEIAIREAEHDLSEIEMRRAVELERRAAGTAAEKGLVVSARTSRICLRMVSGSARQSTNMPSPPALLTAAASAGPTAPPMGA